MKIKKALQKRFFTLVEVIVSMAVFAILMLGLMQFFSSAQGLWTSTGKRNISYDEARTAMNMLAADLMCAYYEEGRTVGLVEDHRYFFMVQDPAANAGIAANVGLAPQLSGGAPRFKGIGFASVRPVKSHPDAVSRLTEVFYRKNGNVLEMRTIADNQTIASVPWVTTARSTPFANFADTPFAPLADPGWESNTGAQRRCDQATADWTQITSNVVRFYVKVYPPNESSTSLNTPLQFSQIYNSSPASNAVTKFPGLVTMTLITIDEDTAKKLKEMNPAVTVFEEYLNSSNDEVSSVYAETPQGILLKEKMQLFTRSVYMDRGIR